MNVLFDPLKIIERLTKLNFTFELSSAAHWILLSFLAVYLFFSFLIFRQTQMMNTFLGTKLSPAIKTGAFLYMAYTLCVFLGVLFF